MKQHPDRVTIAQIPTGQSLELFAAVCAFFDSAIDGGVMASGDGFEVAARLLGPTGLDHHQVAAALQQSAGQHPPAKDQPIVDPDEDETPLAIGHIVDTEHGLDIGIGTSGRAEKWAAHLLGVFMPAFEEMAVDNYLEYEGVDSATGQRLLLTVVKPGGKRPSELRADAEAKLAAALALLAEHGIESSGHPKESA